MSAEFLVGGGVGICTRCEFCCPRAYGWPRRRQVTGCRARGLVAGYQLTQMHQLARASPSRNAAMLGVPDRSAYPHPVRVCGAFLPERTMAPTMRLRADSTLGTSGRRCKAASHHALRTAVIVQEIIWLNTCKKGRYYNQQLGQMQNGADRVVRSETRLRALRYVHTGPGDSTFRQPPTRCRQTTPSVPAPVGWAGQLA